MSLTALPGAKSLGEPKKPRAAYSFFFSEAIKRAQAERPGLGIGEYAVEAGARWRALSAEERRPYGAMALEDGRRYARERDAYLLAEGALRHTDTTESHAQTHAQHTHAQTHARTDTCLTSAA